MLLKEELGWVTTLVSPKIGQNWGKTRQGSGQGIFRIFLQISSNSKILDCVHPAARRNCARVPRIEKIGHLILNQKCKCEIKIKFWVVYFIGVLFYRCLRCHVSRPLRAWTWSSRWTPPTPRILIRDAAFGDIVRARGVKRGKKYLTSRCLCASTAYFRGTLRRVS